jgi:hypothetical protein
LDGRRQRRAPPWKTDYADAKELAVNPYILLTVVVLTVALSATTLVILDRGRKRKRIQDVREVASALGMSFQNTDDGLPFARVLPRWQHRPRIHNVMKGRVLERDVSMFDYRWGTARRGFGEQTVVAFRVLRKLPQFTMVPYRIGFTFEKEIDFVSYPSFSQQYALEGNDESAVRSLFTDRVLRYFEKQDDWCVMGGGEWVLLYRENKLVSPKAIEEFLLKACAASELFTKT